MHYFKLDKKRDRQVFAVGTIDEKHDFHPYDSKAFESFEPDSKYYRDMIYGTTRSFYKHVRSCFMNSNSSEKSVQAFDRIIAGEGSAKEIKTIVGKSL